MPTSTENTPNQKPDGRDNHQGR